MIDITRREFYFIRHAQTDANAKGLMCGGDWDIPLNEEGLKQAELAKPILDSIKNQIDFILCSPMDRTKMTLETINKNSQVEYDHVEGLREWCVGDWEKQPWEDVPNPFETSEDPPNGESINSFKTRVLTTIDESIKLYTKKTLLFVSHGAVAHTLFTHLGVDTPYIKNATFYKVSPTLNSDSKWMMEELL